MLRFHPTMSRYVTRHFVVTFGATIFVIGGLILLFDLIELLRRSATREIPLAQLMVLALLKLPNMLQTTLPFLAQIAAMLTFWRLSRTSELLVLRASGVSAWQFLAPPVIVAVVVGALHVTAINPLGAELYARFQAIEQETGLSDRENLLNFSGGGIWLREQQEDKTVIVRSDAIHKEGASIGLDAVTLFELRNEGHFIRRIEAETATIEAGRLMLSKAWIMAPGLPSEHREQIEIPTGISIGRIQEEYAEPQSVPFWHLPRFIEFFESAGFAANGHRIYWHSLVALPFLMGAMVLVAAVFMINPNLRGGRILLRSVGGVAAGFALYFYSKVTYALGTADTLPLALAAWSPPVVTALLSAGVLFHMEDG